MYYSKKCGLGFVLGFCSMLVVFSQGLIGVVDPIERAKVHQSFVKQSNTNRTNEMPLLFMDWYSGGDKHFTVHWCRVENSGATSCGVSSISNGASWSHLSKTNFHMLVETIESLPTPPSNSIPFVRQVIISGVRSNKGFSAIYDRADIPEAVNRLYELAAPHLKPTKVLFPGGESQKP
jgi:hypothetical protein